MKMYHAGPTEVYVHWMMTYFVQSLCFATALIPHRRLGQFIMPFICVIAGRIFLLMISMRSETVLYGLIDTMK